MQWNNDSENLLDTIVRLQDIEEAKGFFRDLLTESEITEFSQRWKAAQLLSAGVSYSIITKETGLSSTTVARISKWLNGEAGGYKRALAKVHHAQSTSLKGKD